MCLNSSSLHMDPGTVDFSSDRRVFTGVIFSLTGILSAADSQSAALEGESEQLNWAPAPRPSPQEESYSASALCTGAPTEKSLTRLKLAFANTFLYLSSTESYQSPNLLPAGITSIASCWQEAWVYCFPQPVEAAISHQFFATAGPQKQKLLLLSGGSTCTQAGYCLIDQNTSGFHYPFLTMKTVFLDMTMLI